MKRILTLLLLGAGLFVSCDKGSSEEELEQTSKGNHSSENRNGSEGSEDGIEVDSLLRETERAFDIRLNQYERQPISQVKKKGGYLPAILTVDTSGAEFFYHFLTFTALEYGSSKRAKHTFEDLRALSRKRDDGFEGDEKGKFLNAFNKGGSSYVLTGRFILHHRLRCNMSKKDLEKDEEWMERVSQMGEPSGYFRVDCGWVVSDISSSK